MSEAEKPQWKPIYIPHELYDTIRRYLESEDAGRSGIVSPHGLVMKAVREFLKKRGYMEEYGMVVKAPRRPPTPILKLEKLTPTQQEAVGLLMRYREFKEQDAIKWVIDHPKEVEEVETTFGL